ncbi:NAD(FAD)-utilizing dehydrogenase [Granulibacter bethesdensis]|uniref:NAD(FAD)-utilizing dehydrogenase n=2 Tax=Granulibacter bethesdensis TaxID=364410 RepID=A0AAN0RF48_9PROT|nr:NAD(FAD)-utilizing dehydrogenase [Granulibacter bethesdensis]
MNGHFPLAQAEAPDRHIAAGRESGFFLPMLRLTELRLPLDHGPAALDEAVIARLGITPDVLLSSTVFRRGYDARRRSSIALIYTVDVAVKDEQAVLTRCAADHRVMPAPDTGYRFVAQAPQSLPSRPVVIGAGPCGLMAALVLAQTGFRPIILERGKSVRPRTRDTWGLWRRGELDPGSNVQFGEGGAGTFSDGKLYSQIRDPHFYGRKVLTEFVAAGAPEEILTISKPHIGTFRLVTMVERIRASIEALGGEYRFETQVTDLDIEVLADGRRQVRGVVLNNGERIATDHVILAIGHSARDTFGMLHARGVYMEAKPLSIGVRIEHPQALIDRNRFGDFSRHPLLGAADYKLVHHASNGRDVYSFCMCPGGTVVAATSEPGHVVTNGMSQYLRAERNANAGIVVGITPEDFPGDATMDPLAGIAFQRHWERRAFEAGGGGYKAPAQKVGDFLAGRPSVSLGSVPPSYRPGVTPTDLSTCLPDFAVTAIREALPAFDRRIKGFAMEDAVMTAVETRTSSPVRVRRDGTGQSLNTSGLFPAGEGAGYAGGILSAGVDGIRIAEAVALSITGSATPLSREPGGEAMTVYG